MRSSGTICRPAVDICDQPERWATIPGGGGGRGVGGLLNKALYARSKPLPFYTPFLSEKVPLSYTFRRKFLPLSYTYGASFTKLFV